MSFGPADVLIVDDEPAVCAALRDGLAQSGLSCACTSEPAQAKRLLEGHSFGVVLTDVAMPGVSGLDLLAYVKQRMPACKVILMSGLAEPEFLERALALGAYDYVHKPLDISQLVEAVGKALADNVSAGRLPAKAARAMQIEPQLRQVSLQSIRALVQAVEAKDPYTRRHSEQVTHYAVALAQHLKLPDDQLQSIRVAALLHDIGKIGVPDDVLTKPGSLSDEEFHQIRRHPGLGAAILENISLYAAEARLVRYHHEQWNGLGYPDGLTGAAIPVGARIINIADSIDAMLMMRTYKQAYPTQRMIDELRRCSGRQFDPQLAAAAIEWCALNPAKLILASPVVVC